ncbi:MAG: hypothetical protein WAL50_21315 [Kineosporiaceae bacterium]
MIAAYLGSLTVQRPRIDNFTIDVLSGEPWPAEVETAVAALRQRLEQRRDRRLSRLFALGADTVELDLEIDEDFALAVAIAPFTIGGTGISNGAIIWDGNDTGTSVAFDLTEDERTPAHAIHRRASWRPPISHSIGHLTQAAAHGHAADRGNPRTGSTVLIGSPDRHSSCTTVTMGGLAGSGATSGPSPDDYRLSSGRAGCSR